MTIRTQAALLALYADNVSGDIGAEDLQDLVDTLFQPVQWRKEGTVFARETGAGKPTPGVIGAVEYLQFDVGDEAWYHITLPPNVDASQDIEVFIDWAPAAAEAAKTVSWQLDYRVMGDAGGDISTIDGTLTAVDEAVPTTQWDDALTMLTIPAAAIDATDREIHMKITRIASTSDPTTAPVMHHQYAEGYSAWPGAT